jgi:PRTRC genetic system protein C
MLIKNELPRVFLYDAEGNKQPIKLSDPDSKLSAEAVLNFYAQTYPLLTTAKIEGPEFKDDWLQYEFVSTIGTKG